MFDRIQTAYFDVFLTELNFLWWGAYFLIGIILAIRGANFINLFARHRKLYFVISYCMAVLMLVGRIIKCEDWYAYWILRFVLTSFISYIVVRLAQMTLKNHKKLLRYIGFV